MEKIIFMLLMGLMFSQSKAQPHRHAVSFAKMNAVYEKIKTPYKYGLIIVPADNLKLLDCPTVFRKGDMWYMSYLINDGRGYETWLAKSKNLLKWESLGRIMSFSNDTTKWDCNQVAGYIGLQDYTWGGSYALDQYDGKYWMSYIGGNRQGYETAPLSIGIAFTEKDPTSPHEWDRLSGPVFSANDRDTRWWENNLLYKSTVIRDKSKTTGYPFVMYYNASGDSTKTQGSTERIGMAVSDDMLHWRRFGKDPVLNHHLGITGDPFIQKIDDLWVMFYFGAFWPHGNKDGAFNLFACSYDLVNWTDWQGKRLIAPSKSYDKQYAHKSSVVKWNDIVYHFYCAVNSDNQRGIAVATSKDLGKSALNFIAPPDKKK